LVLDRGHPPGPRFGTRSPPPGRGARAWSPAGSPGRAER